MPIPDLLRILSASRPRQQSLDQGFIADVTDQHCQATAEHLTQRVVAFEAAVNQDPWTLADRLWVKHQLDPEDEKRRFSS